MVLEIAHSIFYLCLLQVAFALHRLDLEEGNASYVQKTQKNLLIKFLRAGKKVPWRPNCYRSNYVGSCQVKDKWLRVKC